MTLEYIETVHPGFVFAALKGLPKGWSYRIYDNPVEGVRATSKAIGNGSVRHYTFHTFDEAMAHGIAWAKRRMEK